MNQSVTHQLMRAHLVGGQLVAGEEIALKIDQTLMQDATGTMVMLELEALGLRQVVTELSVQYVDHNLLQTDHRNADDHLFLRSACRRFGIWYSGPGNGVSHTVHMERFGAPGKTLLGSDSHTCSAGAMCMLAVGAGGLEVAMAMAGEPFHVRMPVVHGVKLTGSLPDWVSAKDVILELLRRLGVKGGTGRVFEYYGPGLECLSAMDRHTIANMGAEMGATSSVFPSDKVLRDFLERQSRLPQWMELAAGPGVEYDEHEEIDLGRLEPLIAIPSSPGNVVPVRDVAGKEIYQAYIGSSANPGLRDMAVPALMVAGGQVHSGVSFDINPASRQVLESMASAGLLEKLVAAGARIHQAGCNGCIGMGQAPATGTISLRTVPRNFPGRSGSAGDQVYLCSPETATAGALRGVITDPRTLGIPYPPYSEPTCVRSTYGSLIIPPESSLRDTKLRKGPNVKPLPEFTPLPDRIEGPILLKAGDNVSTDEILPAGAKALPFRSNIPEISRFAFTRLDPSFPDRALALEGKPFFVIAGHNYGQGSSREHAAMAPRYLGLRVVVALSFARIHWQNLANFGILPLTFIKECDYDLLMAGSRVEVQGLHGMLGAGGPIGLRTSEGVEIEVVHSLSRRQVEAVIAGGLINRFRQRAGRR